MILLWKFWKILFSIWFVHNYNTIMVWLIIWHCLTVKIVLSESARTCIFRHYSTISFHCFIYLFSDLWYHVAHRYFSTNKAPSCSFEAYDFIYIITIIHYALVNPIYSFPHHLWIMSGELHFTKLMKIVNRTHHP